MICENGSLIFSDITYIRIHYPLVDANGPVMKCTSKDSSGGYAKFATAVDQKDRFDK